MVDGVPALFYWRDDGTFDQVLEHLHIRLNQEGLGCSGYLDD